MQSTTNLSLFTSVAIPLLSGMLVGLVFRPDQVLFTKVPFYQKLIKSPYSPPNWIFAPVWTFLYITMGYVFYRIQTISNTTLDSDLKHIAELAMQLYWTQLGFNLLFTPLNFGLKSLSLAFIDIVLVLILVIALIITTSYIDTTSTLLLIPYFMWGVYATYLQFFVWKHNTGGSETQPILQ